MCVCVFLECVYARMKSHHHQCCAWLCVLRGTIINIPRASLRLLRRQASSSWRRVVSSKVARARAAIFACVCVCVCARMKLSSFGLYVIGCGASRTHTHTQTHRPNRQLIRRRSNRQRRRRTRDHIMIIARASTIKYVAAAFRFVRCASKTFFFCCYLSVDEVDGDAEKRDDRDDDYAEEAAAAAAARYMA